MLYYNQKNKTNSRFLRSNQTDAEALLWSCIRRKQIKNVQFYRQKLIGNFIVDFYAPSVKMVIEIDGGQHYDEAHIEKDKKRDLYLNQLNLKVLRFDNLQVLRSINSVLEVIFEEITDCKKNPPAAQRTCVDPL
ncbi:MAG TPA: endonuclease domain-containing protein [Gammaproteobacteria bacterium]|nr:endonuclease domain-containing protein [Gammaproteobacteria bacterium]